MRILFLRPKPSADTIGLQHVMLVEPLELEVLASLVNSADTPVIIDMILEKKSFDYFIIREKPDILCISGYITNVPEMIRYCQVAKKMIPGIITIVGGVHCEVCPEDLNDKSIDYRVVRNATTVFPQLLEHIKDKRDLPKGILRPGEHSSLSELPPFDFYFPVPDRSLTSRYRKNYFYIFHNRIALIKTAFGCPYVCNFCFCREITQGAYYERNLDEVIDELISIKEKDIYIVDDDFLTSRIRVKRFMEAIRSANLDKHYLIYGRADFIVKNPDIIQDFRSLGLRTVIVGFESFSDHELRRYNKNIDAKTNEEAMEVLKVNNIDCYATIILPPDWGKEEFAFCKDKLRKLGIHYVNLQPLTPLPGTGLEVRDKTLIIPYSDFSRWDLAHVTIRPEKMSVADYYKNIIKLYNSVLFQPRFMMDYIRKYNVFMLWKMIKGSLMVWRQYMAKIREAKQNA
ncbi:MAG: cobalamin-dependent protein [Bacteroides sp.]|nr:cobalamin-dependent protein [Bacteroides sp.]